MQIEQILLNLEGGKEKYFIKLNPEEKQTTQVILGQQLSSSSDSGNSERRHFEEPVVKSFLVRLFLVTLLPKQALTFLP